MLEELADVYRVRPSMSTMARGVLGGEPPAFMAEAYAELSPDDADHWPAVVGK
ncbi:hypothetical protein MF406_12770 [Georgenia sp. TF02-10]|uniref:hypothetical protein n=1 Tax=Georgenia sp. TF02-10 TaxID=2917725 RepID=UPI001FA70402|nr:hypothetical protein [Georgenia sp. TF02-10]UNX53844.1 hypothetical protein MF406_12770 [Georgenia sp. TF02-10]